MLHNAFVRIILIILGTMVLQVISRVMVAHIIRHSVQTHRYETKQDERKREDTLINVVRTSVAAALWFIAVFAILAQLNINLASLATGAGLISVVIGLGAQNTIRDILAGIFILIEHQYRVGDTVTLSGGTTGINGTTGVVEEISLRITKLRNIDGTLNIVRNGEASIITNHSFKYSNALVDIKVHYTTDIDKLEQVMNSVGADMTKDENIQKDIMEPITFLRIDNFTDDFANVRALGKVRPGTQYKIAGEYRRRLLPALQKAKITLHKIE